MNEHPGGQRIVDVVLGEGAEDDRRRRHVAAVVTGVTTHALVWLWAVLSAPSLEPWSAELAARVHAELTREEIIDLAKPPDPEPPREPEAPAPEPTPPPATAVPPPRHARESPPPPAQAGAILAREEAPDAPVDLTGDTFVNGSGHVHAGGYTTPSGTSTTAVRASREAPRAPPPRARGRDRSRPVAVPEGEWRCPWPRQADDAQIDEQVAVVRVVARADGSVESTALIDDPGYGFGAAAMACALGRRFIPARDRDGRPVRAKSPPIRVRFTR